MENNATISDYLSIDEKKSAELVKKFKHAQIDAENDFYELLRILGLDDKKDKEKIFLAYILGYNVGRIVQ